MAREMSAETKAIIDRLKAEGDLVRNSGTNSLKSVKMEFAKFENVFGAISSNIAAQTDMMRTQLGIAADAQELARTKAQFDELQAKEAPEKNDNTANQDVKPLKDVGEELGNKISSALSMKNLAIGAAGLFVGYNLIKGAIDEATGGGFTNMEKAMGRVVWEDFPEAFNNAKQYLGEIDWTAAKTAINAMSTAINAINWTNFTSAINTMSSTVTTFTTWLNDTGVGDIVTAVIAGGLVSAGARGAVMGVLGSATPNGGLLKKFKGIGPSLAIAAAGLAIAYGDELAEWIAGQMGVDNPEMNETVQNMGTVLKIGGVAMSIGMMFGPPGILVAAAVTAAAGLGVLIHGWIKNTKAESARQFEKDVEEARDALLNAADPDNLDEDALEKVAIAAAEARRRQQLALSDAAIADAEAVEAEMAAVLAQQDVGDGSGGITREQLMRLYQGSLAGNQDDINELQKWALGRAAARGSIRRWWTDQTDEEYAADMIRDLASSIGPNFNTAYGANNAEELQQFMNDQEAWESVGESIANGLLNRPRAGDHHPPLAQPMSFNPTYMKSEENGRLIIYDEFGNPHFLTNAEQNGALGALLRDGTTSGSVSINYITPVSAPQSFNITEGNKSVAMTKIGSGGGFGGSVMREIGLTHFAV
jgi:hypothetical protein